MELIQGVAYKRTFLMVDGTDHITGKTGLTPTVYLSKNGSAFALAEGTVSEVGRGRYQINLTALDVSTLGTLDFSIEAVGADPSDFQDVVVTYTSSLGVIFTNNTNSYLTIAEGDAYAATRMNSEAWEQSNNDQKTKAILTATRQIEQLNFAGDKVDEDQPLEFPRGEQTTIPNNIKIACFEIAIALLDGADLETESRNLSRTSSGYAQTRVNYTREFIQEALANGIVSYLAWSYLKPYLRDTRSIVLSRVN